MKLKLKACVNRSDARTIRHALEQLSAQGSVKKEGDEFVVEAEMGCFHMKETISANCHRRAHYSRDAATFNQALELAVGRLESED